MSTVDAFVACGGRSDKGGVVQREILERIVKSDFGLTIDIGVSQLFYHTPLFVFSICERFLWFDSVLPNLHAPYFLSLYIYVMTPPGID